MNDGRVAFKIVGLDLVRANFDDLEVGDHFKLIEPDGTIVKDSSGCETFVARSNPYVSDGVLTIDCDCVVAKL